MGSPPGEPGRDVYGPGDDFEVQHWVTISRGFCLKRTEVTQDEWKAAMGGGNPSAYKSCAGTGPCPVDSVSWWDAVTYCNVLSGKEGLPACYDLTGCTGTPGTAYYKCTGVTFAGVDCGGYRLPTEAEWEYAARAGTTTSTYGGTIDGEHLECEQPNAVLDDIAWFCGNSGNWPHAVGLLQPNAWGLSDMLGNVWEWTWDWWDANPSSWSPDPTGPATGSGRVYRGGSWSDDARGVRAARRNGDDPGYRGVNLGLRLARPALQPNP